MRELDGQVVRDDSPLNDLLEHFVCVRFPRMRGVDLDQFQFDFDLSMAIFFVAPDGTVLGRFCARTAADKDLNNLKALRRATERALAIYENLEVEREMLERKKRKLPISRVEDIDYGEIQKVVDEGETDRGNCCSSWGATSTSAFATRHPRQRWSEARRSKKRTAALVFSKGEPSARRMTRAWLRWVAR